MGAFVCRLCLSSVFGTRASFDMDTSYIFPQGMLPRPYQGGVVGVGVSEACVGCEAGLPLCSLSVTTLSGVGS